MYFCLYKNIRNKIVSILKTESVNSTKFKGCFEEGTVIALLKHFLPSLLPTSM